MFIFINKQTARLLFAFMKTDNEHYFLYRIVRKIEYRLDNRGISFLIVICFVETFNLAIT